MPLSSRLFNAATHFAMQASEFEPAFEAAYIDALRTVQNQTVARSDEFFVRPQELAARLANEAAAGLYRVGDEVRAAMAEYSAAAARAYPVFLNRAVRPSEARALKGEQFTLIDTDPFDETDVDDDGETDDDDVLVFLGLTDGELTQLLLQLTWANMTLAQHWAVMIERQRIQLLTRINATLALVLVDAAQATPGEQADAARRAAVNELKRQMAGSRGVPAVPTSAANAGRVLVRTQIGTVTQAVVKATHEKTARQTSGVNLPGVPGGQRAQLVAGEVWSAILDDRTCFRCFGLHGKFYQLREGRSTAPQIPLHTLCRCALTPAVRKVRGVEQAALPSIPTFADWFGRQPERVQRKILGPERFALWRAKKLAFRDFVEFRKNVPVRIRTLDRLRRLTGAAA